MNGLIRGPLRTPDAVTISAVILALMSLSLAGCHTTAEGETHHEEHQKVVVTTPKAKDVVLTQPYVCQIHSRRHVDICALEDGYLEAIPIKEGQAVKQGEVLFRVFPPLYKARLDAAKAEVYSARVELENAEKLFAQKVVSQVDVALHKAKLAKAEAEEKRAEVELNFTEVKAPFDGIVDRQAQQQGSLVKEGDVLTTLSDNHVMWVYFNVPEARYLEYKARQGQSQDHSRLKLLDSQIELVLANGSKFDQDAGDTVTIEGQFNNQTGNIPFRADFPNPYGLLRHGQTGTVRIHQTLRGAIVIPQRATFEILDKQYVYVVDDEGVVHQRLIEVVHELEDIFVVKGLEVNEKIILEGIRQVRDGEKVEFEFEKPEEALSNQKYHAE